LRLDLKDVAPADLALAREFFDRLAQRYHHSRFK
jgi:hypothetical protein